MFFLSTRSMNFNLIWGWCLVLYFKNEISFAHHIFVNQTVLMEQLEFWCFLSWFDVFITKYFECNRISQLHSKYRNSLVNWNITLVAKNGLIIIVFLNHSQTAQLNWLKTVNSPIIQLYLHFHANFNFLEFCPIFSRNHWFIRIWLNVIGIYHLALTFSGSTKEQFEYLNNYEKNTSSECKKWIRCWFPCKTWR